MNYQEISYLVMVGISLVYITGIVIVFGVLPSISRSFYELEKLHKRFLFWDLSMLFTFWASFTAITALLSCGPDPWIVAAATGLLLVGAAPYFDSRLGKIPHYLGAATSLVSIHGYITFSLDMLGVVIVSLFCILIVVSTRKNDKNWLWWVESIAFVIFFIAKFEAQLQSYLNRL